MDIAMTTTTVMPMVATPLPWHGDVARTALPGTGDAGAAGFVGRVVSDVPISTVAGFRTSRTAAADTRTAKQPHPPRGLPR
jgi:hypothetical protein